MPTNGIFCDLLWSDPINTTNSNWKVNTLRNISFFFGVKEAKIFLAQNKLKMIIRGHEVTDAGYKYQSFEKIPLTLTIFSAPNYANIHKNKGCVAKIHV